MMAAVKGKNTLPELSVRRALHAKGLRFRLHDKSLAGRPDIVLPKWNAAIFVHGCFWHLHGCSNSNVPRTRQDFWLAKLNSNVSRDRKHIKQLLSDGWRVAIVWECSIRKELKSGDTALFNRLEDWLKNGESESLEV
jgi:DNA mismatch endonuclease, patch repair protein